MRQIVSLIKDNQAHYALVDDDDGSLIPFADLLIPDPERFGLHESALLGTNLVTALGLNGTKRPKAVIPRVGSVSPAQERLALEPPEPPVRTETAKERRARQAREAYARKGKSNNSAKRFVSIDEVLAIIEQYPEGIRVRDIAERLWRQTDGQGTDTPMPNWFYTAVSNRLTAAREKLKTRGVPLPFVEEKRPVLNKDGVLGSELGMFIKPLPRSQPPAAPEP